MCMIVDTAGPRDDHVGMTEHNTLIEDNITSQRTQYVGTHNGDGQVEREQSKKNREVYVTIKICDTHR